MYVRVWWDLQNELMWITINVVQYFSLSGILTQGHPEDDGQGDDQSHAEADDYKNLFLRVRK